MPRQEKKIFLRGDLGSSSTIRDGTGTRYGIEILHKCYRRVQTQKVLGANSYVC